MSGLGFRCVIDGLRRLVDEIFVAGAKNQEIFVLLVFLRIFLQLRLFLHDLGSSMDGIELSIRDSIIKIMAHL